MKPKLLTTVLSLAVVVSACGSDSGATTTTVKSAATSPSTTLPPGTIGVKLIDIDAQTQAMTLSSATAATGAVSFVVTNSGNLNHEFVVIQTDKMATDLPYDKAADLVVEEGLTVVDEIEEILPGETKTLKVDLKAGRYALVCNLVKHWHQGMHADFTVT
jgi:uncharacterized cupredoxin-like copper-binding protein